MSALLYFLHTLMDATRRLITLKGITSQNLCECFMQISVESFSSVHHGIKIYKKKKKKVAAVESYFQSTICEKTVTRRSFILPRPSFLLISFILFRSRSRGDRERKRSIYSRLVIKSKQKGIDVIEVGSGTFFSLFFSLRLVGLELSERNCIRENGKDHVRDCIIQYRHGVNLYIHDHPFIHCNVNPFLFRSNHLSHLSFSFSLSLFLLFLFVSLILRVTCRAVCTIFLSNVIFRLRENLVLNLASRKT